MTEINLLLSERAAKALRETVAATGRSFNSAVALALRDEFMIRSGGQCENEFRIIKRHGSLGRHIHFPLAEQARGRIRSHLHPVVSEPLAADSGVVTLKLNLAKDDYSELTKLALSADISPARVVNQAILDARLIVGLAVHKEGLFEGKGWSGRWFPSVLYNDAGGVGEVGKLVETSTNDGVA